MKKSCSLSSLSTKLVLLAAGSVLTLLLYVHHTRLGSPEHRYLHQIVDAVFDQDEVPTTRYYDWTVERTELAPDGVKRDMITVNRQFPGPTIQGG